MLDQLNQRERERERDEKTIAMHTVTQSLTLRILIDEVDIPSRQFFTMLVMRKMNDGVDIKISMHCTYTVHIHTRQDTETMLDKMTNE